jgi:hypothetical protein
MDVSFNQEELNEDLAQELMPLIQAHYQEISFDKSIQLAPDWEFYYTCKDSGMLKIYTARAADTKTLVGYAVFFLRRHPHYRQSIQADQDVLFIDKSKRGFGRKFIDYCDIELKKLGVHAVHQHVKASFNFGPMLEELGYSLVDYIYRKTLSN